MMMPGDLVNVKPTARFVQYYVARSPGSPVGGKQIHLKRKVIGIIVSSIKYKSLASSFDWDWHYIITPECIGWVWQHELLRV